MRAAKARSHACEPVDVVDPVFEQAGPAVHEVVGDAAGPDAKGHVVEERHSPASLVKRRATTNDEAQKRRGSRNLPSN